MTKQHREVCPDDVDAGYFDAIFTTLQRGYITAEDVVDLLTVDDVLSRRILEESHNRKAWLSEHKRKELQNLLDDFCDTCLGDGCLDCED